MMPFCFFFGLLLYAFPVFRNLGQPYRIILWYFEDVSITLQALLSRLHLNRGCLRHCPNILILLPFPTGPSTCPLEHPHFGSVQLSLLRFTQGSVLIYVGEGGPDYYPINLPLRVPEHLHHRGFLWVSSTGARLSFPPPDRLVHTSFV